MTRAPGAWLEDLTWPEVEARIEADAVVVVPIGAVAKEHGPHLPMNTDYRLARGLANGIAAALPVLIAPVVCFGYYPAFRAYPGSQHLSAATFQALLRELLDGLIAQGARRLAIVNTGVSTEAPIRIVVRDVYAASGVAVHSADIRNLGNRADAQLQQELGGHGDEAETAMILTLDGDAVRMHRAATDYGNAREAPRTVFYTPTVFTGDPNSGPDYSATGVRGDPTLATAEKGQIILAAMIEELVAGLRALFPPAQ